MEKPVGGTDGVVALSYLFDRPRNDHPWLDALSELDRSPAIGEPQVTANWRMDHRVEPSREDVLLAPGGFPKITNPGGESFRQARRNYFEQFLCRPVGTDSGSSELPAYLTDANLGNRIPAERISPNHDLLHLASLNTLLRRALSGRYDAADLELEIESGMGRSLPTTIDAATVDRIAASVRSAGEESVRRLAGLISDTLGPTEPHWWAAFAYEVEAHIQGEDWTEAAVRLGLGHLKPGDWLLAWRYSSRDAGPSTGLPSWRPRITASIFHPLPAMAMGLPCRWPQGAP
ncbi:hypothetical protein [Candidatus Thiosymbion oneisti]|uniref:hypothetical protein n=1 Tax=Candidatus Thiosymbion oneisti TaxID=589554 RepID=UPI0010612ACB|nr:hypothetical protein [Candidatus Thiosymbion oneisti]